MASKGLNDTISTKQRVCSTWNGYCMKIKGTMLQIFKLYVWINSSKQIIEEFRSPQAMKPGQEARLDYENVRHVVVNIFMSNEPLKGKSFFETTEFKTKKDWAVFEERI